MSEFKYVGSELELFSAVKNWKDYWSSQVRPFIAGDVLEAGAGLGSNTAYLDTNPVARKRWVCLEPDPNLTAQLSANLTASAGGKQYETVCGTLQGVDGGQRFDTIIYIDVLEHIEDDRGELELAASRLRPGGRVIVLSPAHQSLFTPFDAAIGHFRRYDKSMLRAITPPSLVFEKLTYLDSLGLALSAGNRVFLRQSMPTKEQLHVWDHYVVPVSRILDKCTAGLIGKSILAVWQRPGK